eukprot:163875-Chlamydomonas_euryale.AAC.3
MRRPLRLGRHDDAAHSVPPSLRDRLERASTARRRTLKRSLQRRACRGAARLHILWSLGREQRQRRCVIRVAWRQLHQQPRPALRAAAAARRDRRRRHCHLDVRAADARHQDLAPAAWLLDCQAHAAKRERRARRGNVLLQPVAPLPLARAAAAGVAVFVGSLLRLAAFRRRCNGQRRRRRVAAATDIAAGPRRCQWHWARRRA